MAANIAAPTPVDDVDELETRPMTDSEHHATFGWGWDDPERVEELA